MGLRELRKARGLTLKALGEKSGVHWVKIAQYETGKLNVENMSLKNAVKLSAALGCSPEQFMTTHDEASDGMENMQ